MFGKYKKNILFSSVAEPYLFSAPAPSLYLILAPAQQHCAFQGCAARVARSRQTLLLELEPTFLILTFAALNLIKANDENILSRESELK